MTNFENLTTEEKKLVASILKEYSTNGYSSQLNNILNEDWAEIPVDMHTFLHDKQYLGTGLYDSEGRFTLFEYWEELLYKIYPDPMKPATCNTLALTGAIGIGKSTEAVIVGLYELYRMMCLKNPSVYYGIMSTDTIAFAVINITLEASKDVAWDKLQNLAQSSPWFMSHGYLTTSLKPEWYPDPKYQIDLICGSQPRHFIGKALFWSFFDEISFIQNQDVEKQKQKAMELISSATARMQSRFMRNDVNPTIMVMASSKRTEQSFLETWIKTKKENESKTTIIVDEPQWIIRRDKQSKNTFKVAIGNKFLTSEVLPKDVSEHEINLYINRGYRILDVPIGYYDNFIDNIEIALTDIAGISTTSLSTFISGERLSLTKIDGTNPFTKDIITVGNAVDDKVQYNEFFDLTAIPESMKNKPMFIHMDLSISGDKTGIAGVWIKGKKQKDDGSKGTDLVYQLAFCVSVKAPKGCQVSFEKTRNFIYWLKRSGFAIKEITMDTFQSADMLQALRDKGFITSILSVDRVNTDKICLPYQYFKSCIYEQRILIPKSGTKLLTDELLGLEKNNNSGKIDHSPSSINSKDSADAVCGALYTASLHGEEYSYEYGENLVDMTDFNLETSSYINESDDFAKLLLEEHQKNNSNYADFGIGLPKEIIGSDVSNGLMFW